MLSEVTYENGEVSYERVRYRDFTGEGFRGTGKSVYIVKLNGYHYYQVLVDADWYLYYPVEDSVIRVERRTERTFIPQLSIRNRVIKAVENLFKKEGTNE